ncbi:TrmH family RNA methyltransferase [Alloscardovia omnicolens]|uniref:TrmH family RNA methyltransferase n=1 Tax=Alloscardovia omnicolens TaxID=419015 RepID=UPI003A6B6CC0
MPLHRDIMDNPKSHRVRLIAELASRKARKKTGLFLVEGPQAVREAVRYASEFVRDVYVRKDYATSEVLREVVHSAMEHNLYVHGATENVMDAISSDCQGIAAVVRTEAVSRPLDNLATPPHSLTAACWQLRDPGNAGTIIRAADASGCHAVILVDECVDITNPKVVRSTAGSLFHVPIYYASEDAFFEKMREQSVHITAAEIYGTDKTPVMQLQEAIQASDVHDSQAILFGNEARGLNPHMVDQCNQAAVIPLYGKAESLNVAMSASVMLYAFAMHMQEDAR